MSRTGQCDGGGPGGAVWRVRVLAESGWRPGWEPVFVAARDTPDWDERFLGAGHNKIQQVCSSSSSSSVAHPASPASPSQAFHMCLLRYKFKVLEGLFLVHEGIKRGVPHEPNATDAVSLLPSLPHSILRQSRTQVRNRELYQTFREHMKPQYPREQRCFAQL